MNMNSVLSMVEGLKEKCETQREEVEKDETTEGNAHKTLQAHGVLQEGHGNGDRPEPAQA